MSPLAVPSITAAVLYAPGDIRILHRPIGPPQAGHVQVQVVSTGLCGSDEHYFSQGRNGDFDVRAPFVLGHEASGIVTAIGPAVNNFVVGDRVAIEAGINCRSCSYCEKGRYNLCKNMRFCSSAARIPHVDGTLQSKINHPAHVLHRLPDRCTFELASLAEPLSVLIHAFRRCRFSQNQSALVFGVGTIGLLACALAKRTGASRVVAIDINPTRCEFAKQNGFADDVFCPPKSSSETDEPSSSQDPCCSINSSSSSSQQHPTEEQLKQARSSALCALSHFSQPEGFDTVFECTGSQRAIQSSLFSATPGGRVMLIGMGTSTALLPVSTFALKEIEVQSSFRYCDTYPEALHLLATDDRLARMVKRLVTHRFRLEDTKEAFELLRRGVDDHGRLVLKIMVGNGEPC